jgi:hypothetical protein
MDKYLSLIIMKYRIQTLERAGVARLRLSQINAAAGTACDSVRGSQSRRSLKERR